MNKILIPAATVLCISIILGVDAGYPLALRLENAVAITVGLFNSLLLLGAAMLMLNQDLRGCARCTWRENRLPSRILLGLSNLAWLATLAWADWPISFGIRLLWLLVWVAVIYTEEPRDDQCKDGVKPTPSNPLHPFADVAEADRAGGGLSISDLTEPDVNAPSMPTPPNP